MIFSCFSLTAYDLAVAPFARTNCLNQIMVCIPIAVVKLLQSMCRKISGLLPFPWRRCGTAVWPGSSGRSTQRNAQGSLQRWEMLLPQLLQLSSYFAMAFLHAGSTEMWNCTFWAIKICLQFSVKCSLGTNISTVNIILWDRHLYYRHDWLRFLL